MSEGVTSEMIYGKKIANEFVETVKQIKRFPQIKSVSNQVRQFGKYQWWLFGKLLAQGCARISIYPGANLQNRRVSLLSLSKNFSFPPESSVNKTVSVEDQ